MTHNTIRPPRQCGQLTRRVWLSSVAAGCLSGLVACAPPLKRYVEAPLTPTPELLAALAPRAPVANAVATPTAPSLLGTLDLPRLAASEPDPAQQPVRLLGGLVGPLHGPAFMARALALWPDRYQMKVDFQFGDLAATTDAVQRGQFDAALLPVAAAIVALDRGVPLVIVAAGPAGGHSVVVTPGIDGAQRLRGKSYGSPARNDYLDLFFRQRVMANRFQLRAEEMTFVATPFDAAPEALRRGEVAACLLPEPWATRAVDNGARRLLDWREVWDDGRYWLECLALNRRFARERPGAARRLVWAHLDGLRLMDQRRPALIQALSQMPGQAVGARVYKEAVDRVDLEQARISPEFLVSIVNDLRQNRSIARAYTANEVADTSFQDGYAFQGV